MASEISHQISTSSLFTSYSIQSAFTSEEVEGMIRVVDEWKEHASNHIAYLNDPLDSGSLFQRHLAQLLPVNEKWSWTCSRRTAHVFHVSTPGIRYKACRSAPGRAYPLCNILRAPMAVRMRQTIHDLGLSRWGVPKKVSFPWFHRRQFLNWISEKSMKLL